MKAIILHKQVFFFLFFLFAYYKSVAQPTTEEWLTSLNESPSSKTKADICFKLAVRYFDRLKFDSALYYASRIKKLSEDVNYEIGFGKYYLAKTIEYQLKNKTIELQEVVDKAIKIFTKHHDNLHLGLSYRMLAKNKSVNAEYEQAIKFHQKALSAFKVELNETEISKTLSDMGRAYGMANKLDSAAACLVAALAYSEKLGDKRLKFLVSSELGTLYDKAGETDKAGYYYEYALKNQVPGFSKVQIRNVLEHYANYLIEKKNLEKADSAVDEYQKLTDLFKDSYGRLREKLMRGKINYQRNDYHAALKEFRQSYQLISAVHNNFSDIAGVTLLIGMTELKVGEPDSAIFYLKYARNNVQSFHDVSFEAEACLLIAEAYQKKNRLDSAFRYARLHSFFIDSAYRLKNKKAVFEITTRYETTKKEQEIKMLQKESEVTGYLLKLNEEQLQKQSLEAAQKANQFILVSKQNEISKLDAGQKTLSLENEKKENEKNQAKLKLLETEAAYQKLLVSKESQRKNLAYAGIAGVLILGGFAVYRYTRSKKMQNQQVVLNERLRISRELHDEVGSTLSGIAMYSHLTKQQIKETKTEEVEKSLNTMQQSAGEMIGKLNDIVWLINPEKDSLQRFVERLEEYASAMAITKNMELKMNLPAKLSDLQLPVETRRNIYLFCKEAINNAVKYSEAGILEITMKESDNKKISISISDNGKGFAPLTIKKGNGLNNMQQRVEKMKGEFSLLAAPGQGTSVSLNCKIT